MKTIFKPGDKVTYVGNKHHVPEKGVVTSTNEFYIFVDYFGNGHGYATLQKDLIKDDE